MSSCYHFGIEDAVDVNNIALKVEYVDELMVARHHTTGVRMECSTLTLYIVIVLVYHSV